MSTHAAPDGPVDDGFTWDDVLWDRVWERVLDQVERHEITMQVLRRRPAADAFSARVGRELARRLRRRAIVLALAWGAFGVFWLMIVGQATSRPGVSPGPAWAMVVLAGVVVAGCLVLRRHLAPVARAGVGQ